MVGDIDLVAALAEGADGGEALPLSTVEDEDPSHRMMARYTSSYSSATRSHR